MFLLVLVPLLFIGGNAIPNNRVVNGTDAKNGEFPFMVSVRLTTWHTCGGSILNPRFILTAAHCASGYSPSALTVQYGLIRISRNFTNSIQVEKIAIHEEYNPDNFYRNDVAVLKLEYSIPLSETVQPITLPDRDRNFEEWPVGILTGWGSGYTEGDTLENLQKVNIYIYPQEECAKAHGSKVSEIYHVCAGVLEGGKGQCSGDSGGPLTLDGVQVGIVSWSIKPCTIAGYPGVFARVSHYTNWINKKLLTM